jgi:NADH:ubiquinone oxidoreductase subunit E
LRGSKNVIAEIERLIAEFQLDHKVLLKGSFCHEKCTGGVTVMVGEKLFTGVAPKDIEDLFEKEILPIKGDPECL